MAKPEVVVSGLERGEKLVLTEEQALEVITFLVSSAEICLREPIYYGTLRLVDAASRLIGLIQKNTPVATEGFLRGFKEDIDTHKTLAMWDREAYYDFLRKIPFSAAKELKRVREVRGKIGGEV